MTTECIDTAHIDTAHSSCTDIACKLATRVKEESVGHVCRWDVAVLEAGKIK